MQPEPLRYLQFRDLYNREIKHNVNFDRNGITRTMIGLYNSKKYRIISTLYQHLMERTGNTTLYVKQKWEKELGVNITEDEWLHIWRTQRSATASRSWREHCWRNVIGFFFTPKMKSKHLSVAQPCWRQCGAIHVDHSHVFWLCPKIEQFWVNVLMITITIQGYDIPLSCKVLYFGKMIGDIVLREDIFA